MEFVNGKDDIPYMTWKLKIPWFETTNQISWCMIRIDLELGVIHHRMAMNHLESHGQLTH